MRETTRAGRSPAEAWERETEAPTLGSALLGARIIAAARVAAAVHMAAFADAAQRSEASGVAERSAEVRR